MTNRIKEALKNKTPKEKTNQHFGFIVKPSVKDRFDRIADELGMSKVNTLELAIELLEESLSTAKSEIA